MRARRVRAAAWLSQQGASMYAWSTAPASFSWQRSSGPKNPSKSTCTPQPDFGQARAHSAALEPAARNLS